MITISKVSVIALCVKNLHFLNRIALKMPENKPIKMDTNPNIKKLPAISNTLPALNSNVVDLKLVTVLNRMMLTISLNTPSP